MELGKRKAKEKEFKNTDTSKGTIGTKSENKENQQKETDTKMDVHAAGGGQGG